MRKAAALVILSGILAAATHAQGTISFQNFTSAVGGRVYTNSAGALIPMPAGYHVELLAGVQGALTINDLTSRRIFVSSTGNGQFFDGSVVTLAGVPAGLGNSDPTLNAVLALRGWTGNYTDYASALAGGGLVAATSIFSNPTGGGGAPPATPANLVGWLANNPLLFSVPEPGTIALFLMGGASLLFFCRR